MLAVAFSGILIAIALGILARLNYEGWRNLRALVQNRFDDWDVRTREVVQYRPPSPPPPPFVCVLCEATSPYGPTTCGGVGQPKNGRIEVELQTQQPLTAVRVTVFCDLSRVNIHGIFCGTDLVTTSLGSCPVAFFKEWHPGVKLWVQAVAF